MLHGCPHISVGDATSRAKQDCNRRSDSVRCNSLTVFELLPRRSRMGEASFVATRRGTRC